MTRSEMPLWMRLQSNAPASPASGYKRIYPDSAGRIATKDSGGLIRYLPFEFFYNVKDYAAVGDGTTDDAGAIQAAIDLASSTNPGSTVYFPPGTYLVNSELELKGSCTIWIDQGATVKRGSSSMQYIFKNFNSSYAPTAYGGRGHIRFTGGGTIDGGALSTGGLTTSVTLVVFAQCTDIIVENLTFQNVVDWHGVEFNSTSNGTVRNCVFQGFKVVTAGRYISEAIQIDLAINSSALPGIGAGAYDNTPCKNITIDGNTVRSFGGLKGFGCLTGSHSWADGFKQTKIRVVNNHCEDLSDYMVNATYWDSVVISNNVCYNSNSFLQIMLPSSMTHDMYNFVVDSNVVQISGTQNDNTAVNSYCVNLQAIDATNSGALASVGTGDYIENVILSNNVFDGISNGDSVIRGLNILNLVIEACTFNNVNSTGAVIRSTGNRSAHIAECRMWNFAGKGVIIEQGTAATGPPTSISSQVVNCTMENGDDYFVDTVSWQTTIQGCTLMSQNTSAKAMIHISAGATDAQVIGNTIWKRDGNAGCNGIEVSTTGAAGNKNHFFSANFVKGFATATSTAASAVTNTAVWSISGTATLNPAIASFFTSPANYTTSTN